MEIRDFYYFSFPLPRREIGKERKRKKERERKKEMLGTPSLGTFLAYTIQLWVGMSWFEINEYANPVYYQPSNKAHVEKFSFLSYHLVT